MSYTFRSLREIEEELERKKAERRRIKNVLEELYFHDKVKFLKEVDELFEQGKLDTLILQDRTWTYIKIYPLCQGEQRLCNNWPNPNPWNSKEELEKMSELRFQSDDCIFVDLSRIYSALFEFYGNKCVCCGISYDECIDKYDKPLELHHVHPISFDSVAWSVNPVRSFVPVCPKCHLRGAQ